MDAFAAPPFRNAMYPTRIRTEIGGGSRLMHGIGFMNRRRLVVFFLACVCVALLAVSANAQPAAQPGYWDDRFGDPGGRGLGLNGRVFALAQHPLTGEVYAGGNFSEIDGTRGIARWTGDGWAPVGGGTRDRVFALAFDPQGNLYVGGEFRAVEQTDGTRLEASYVARWDGTSWSALPTGPDDEVRVLAYDANRSRLYVGGTFDSVVDAQGNPLDSPNIAYWDGSDWSAVGQGAEGGFGSSVEALAVDPTSGDVYVGGRFFNTAYNSDGTAVAVNHLGVWDGTEWQPFGNPDGYPNVLTFDASGQLYAGGDFTAIGGVATQNLARYDGASWESLGGDLADDEVEALLLGADGLYVGGSFTEVRQADGETVALERIAYLDFASGAWAALGPAPPPNAEVRALAFDGSDVFIGGLFREVGARASTHIARWVTSPRPFPTTLTTFAVDLRALERYEVITITERPMLSVLSGDLQGSYYLYDADGDSVFSVSIDQPASTSVDYHFLIDRNGNAVDEDDWLRELDSPTAVRSAAIPGASPVELPTVLFDDRTGTGPVPGAAGDRRLWRPPGSTNRGTFFSGSAVREIYYTFERLDRLMAIAVREYQAPSDLGTLPEGIARIADHALWRVEAWPAAADFSVLLEWAYEEVSGVRDPEALRMLYRPSPTAPWQVVPTEVDLTEELLRTPDIRTLRGEWTIGSTNADNLLTALPPSVPSEPVPGDGVLNTPTEPTLTWSSLDAARFDVYLWPQGAPEPTRRTADVREDLYQPNPLSGETWYNWRVVGRNLHGETESPTWSFRVGDVPDLTTTDVHGPGEAFSGQPIELTWTVENVGANATNAPRWIDAIYLSDQSRFDPDEATLLSSEKNLSYLNPNERYTNTATVLLPDGIAGPHYLHVVTDSENSSDGARQGRLLEQDETKNTGTSAPLAITLTPFADLEVEDVIAPDVVFSGDSIEVAWTVRNVGDGQTDTDQWFDAVFLSEDETFDFNFTLNENTLRINERFLDGVGHQGALEAGATYDVSYRLPLPEDAIGAYHLFIATDVGTGNKVPKRGQVYEFNQELDNWTAEPIDVTLTPPPDLVVAEVNAPSQALSGETIDLSWTVQNAGPAPTAADTWRDLVYYSPTAAFDSTTAVSLGSFRHEGPLANDASYTGSASVRVPDGISGPAYFFVVTDWGDAVFEHTFETNNRGVHAEATTVELAPYPDLRIESVTAAPAQATAGDQIAVQYALRNAGSRAATPDWADSIFVSAQASWDRSQATWVGTVRQPGGLAAGAVRSQTASITLPASLDGAYYVFVQSDAADALFEYPDTEQNVAASPERMADPYPPVDLVAELDAPPSTAQSGAAIDLSATVRNVAAGRGRKPVWIDRVYLSTDATVDPEADQVLATFLREAPLAGGDAYRSACTVQLPNGIAGEYFVLFQVDADDEEPEVDESNNVARRPLTVTLAPPSDLRIAGFDGPESAQAGAPVTFTWTVENAGTGATEAPWTDALYLSADREINQDDALLGTVARDAPLAGNGSYEASLRTALPVYAAGTYYLILQTDSGDDTYEHLAEGNNRELALIELTLPPPTDLVVENLTLPAAATPGEHVEVAWTVRNAGTNPARGQMREAVFVSSDATWDPDDPLLGVVEREIDLAPGATGKHRTRVDVATVYGVDAQGNLSGPLPGVLPGDYHVIVRTDIGNAIRETDDDNNTAVSQSTLSTTVPTLPEGTPETLSLAEGESRYYRFDTPTDADVRLTLTSDTPEASNELYVAYDRLPVAGGDFDAAAAEPFRANQQLLGVRPPQPARVTYVLVTTQSLPEASSTQTVQLQRETLDFSIQTLTPAVGGQGQVTTLLRGAGFRDSTDIYLMGPDGMRSDAARVDFVNTTELEVRWHLEDVPVGTYDVVAETDAQTTVLPQGFTVEEKSASDVKIRTALPEAVRGGGRGDFAFTFTNNANVDIPYLDVQLQVINVGALEIKDLVHISTPARLFAPAAEERGLDYLVDGDLRVVSLITRDLSPGDQASVILQVEPAPAGAISYSYDVTPFSAEEYTTMLQTQHLDERRAILANPEQYDAATVTLAADLDNFFAERFGDYLDAGLIDNLPSLPTDLSTQINTSENDATGNASIAAGLPATSSPASPAPSKNDDDQEQPQCEVVFCKDNSEACDCHRNLPPRCFGLNKEEANSWWCQRRIEICELKNFREFFNPFNKRDCGCTTVKEPCDPNDMIGPAGFGEEGWIASRDPLPYTIRFENDPARATASAQVVNITHPLDPDTDERTFRLGEFGFGPFTFEPPDNSAFYRDRLDVSDSLGVMVDVTAGLDVVRNEAFWRFTTIDPATGDQPVNDPTAGFLPINDASGSGEGFVNYTIMPEEDTPTGERIEAQADIVFDINAPIKTPPIFNTVDADPPVSALNVLPANADTTAFEISWNARDTGAGVRETGLYVSKDGAPFQLHTTLEADTTLLFAAETGSEYEFYTQATDHTGNTEPTKSEAEGGITVGNTVVVFPGDTNDDGVVNQNDVLEIGAFFGISGPERGLEEGFAGAEVPIWSPVEAAFADANGDGIVNQNDLLPIGTYFGRQAGKQLASTDGFARLRIPPLPVGTRLPVHLQVDASVAQLFGLSAAINHPADIFSVREVRASPTLDDGALLPFKRINASTGEVALAFTRTRGAEPVFNAEGLALVTVDLEVTAPMSQTAEIVLREGRVNVRAAVNGGAELIHLASPRAEEIPTQFALEPNYPNPFHRGTIIRFGLPEPTPVTLEVYDILGRRVARLKQEEVMDDGWHTVHFRGRRLASGVYFYRLWAGTFTKTRKMVVVR